MQNTNPGYFSQQVFKQQRKQTTRYVFWFISDKLEGFFLSLLTQGKVVQCFWSFESYALFLSQKTKHRLYKLSLNPCPCSIKVTMCFDPQAVFLFLSQMLDQESTRSGCDMPNNTSASIKPENMYIAC